MVRALGSSASARLPVALDHHHLVRRVLLFHQQREVQAGGPAADADDLHDPGSLSN